MIIRNADLDRDMHAIIKGGRKFAEETAYWVRLPSDDSIFSQHVARLAMLDSIEVLVADDGGQVIGCIAMLYAPSLWNPMITLAEELFWSTFQGAPFGTGPQLVKKAIHRARERHAVPIFRALVTMPGVAAVYRREGLEPAETIYTEVQ